MNYSSRLYASSVSKCSRFYKLGFFMVDNNYVSLAYLLVTLTTTPRYSTLLQVAIGLYIVVVATMWYDG